MGYLANAVEHHKAASRIELDLEMKSLPIDEAVLAPFVIKMMKSGRDRYLAFALKTLANAPLGTSDVSPPADIKAGN